MVRGVYKRGSIYWIRYAGIVGDCLYEQYKVQGIAQSDMECIKLFYIKRVIPP
jgi:hypothetical protein